MTGEDGRRRAVVERVTPEVDCGRFAAKRVIGDVVEVEADVYADGHDAVSAVLLYRRDGQRKWREAPMSFIDNDRWGGRFTVDEIGGWSYTVQAWVDDWKTWRRDMLRRVEAGQDVAVDLLIGAALVQAAAARATGADSRRLADAAERLRDPAVSQADRTQLALAPGQDALMGLWPDRRRATMYEHELPVWADRERARFSAWYELFPRSTAPDRKRPGTLRDLEARLAYVAELGFDVVYLPPIHPIGRTRRKGKNNAETAAPGDVGSPWAIGGTEGGHKAIHPDLGTDEQFRRLVERARAYDLEIALDLAYQVSPDHPYARDHSEWFRKRPDGAIQYAENPPKKYQDIYPFDFESDDWKVLWRELKSVVEHWIERGVKIFRVDNPHTKPFPFWEWLIAEIRRAHPDVIFLSEAFTRPKVMYRLAKLGFTQSYTYFAWRTTRWELVTYMEELTRTEVKDYFRPNFWPNTPDILTEQLQMGGAATFVTRLVLAATLSSNYGIYGPAFELLEHTPREPGSEEYLHSEKYQVRYWDLERPDSLREVIARVNRARRDNPALHDNRGLRFHDTQNDQVLAYSKRSADGSNIVLTIVNLSPRHTHSGFVELPIYDWGIGGDEMYEVHDALTDTVYQWRGMSNYVELSPHRLPAHIFRVVRHKR